jgi:glycosyltransferase involved in cell wall biosynthesis
MHVAIVLQNDYPHAGEARPRRLARSLSQQGHQVTILAWNSRGGPQMEDLGYARVIRFSFFLKSYLYRLLSFPSPLNPFWVIWIWKIARKIQPDLFIASNIRIALPMILAAKLLRKPTILDLQEHNEQLTRMRGKTRLAHYLTRNSRLVAWLERACVKCADRTWVVVAERMKSLNPRIVSQGRVTIVSNTTDLAEVQAAQNHRRVKDQVFTMIFIGFLRGDFTLVAPFIRALGCVIRRDKNVRLLLGGVDGDRKSLDILVEQSGVQGHVQADGIIEPMDIPRWLQQGHLAIVPYQVTPCTNATISSKLFHYFAAGLPVLSTAMEPTRRIIEELKCGAVIPEGSGPEEIAEIILRLKNAGEELDAMGLRAQQAVKEKYNWEVDFSRAFGSLEELLSPAKKPWDFSGGQKWH